VVLPEAWAAASPTKNGTRARRTDAETFMAVVDAGRMLVVEKETGRGRCVVEDKRRTVYFTTGRWAANQEPATQARSTKPPLTRPQSGFHESYYIS